MVLVDCRNVSGHADPIVQHGYFARSRAMADDIAAVLRGAAPETIGNRSYVVQERAWRIIQEPVG